MDNYKISSYRLGDLLLVGLNQHEINLLLNDYPNSIGAEYIQSQNDQTGIKKITQIVLNRIEKYKSLLPDDIENSVVIHLRLGDVVSGEEWHEKIKRPLDIAYYESLPINKKNIYILGKCFFAHTSSTNYNECIINSNEYLSSVIGKLNATHFDGGDADVDLCCAVLADTFVQGRGYFSKLIVEIRKEIGKYSIETETEVSK